MTRYRAFAMTCVALALAMPGAVRGETIWVEGEKPSKATVKRFPQWYDQVKKDQLSGGDFISNWDAKSAGQVEYKVTAPDAGSYEFWLRANPTGTTMSYKLNADDWKNIDTSGGSDQTNIAADGKLDIRFLAWIKVGQVELKKGANTVAFRFDSENNKHGMIDCFAFSTDGIQPQGKLSPKQLATAAKKVAEASKGWFAFNPPTDKFDASSGFDLRSLNEKVAGENGFIQAKGSQFVHGNTGEPVRFWTVNGGNGGDYEKVRATARMLAKRGVNMIRIHTGLFKEDGSVDPEKIQQAITTVEAMKEEGIYTHFSIYFPLWLTPKPNSPFLKGYDGNKKPFASLYFNEDFQKVYQSWWRSLLETPSPRTKKKLADEPAVFGAEIINEDSFFFWTFNKDNVPDPQLQILEKLFGDWTKKKHGSIDNALKAWNGMKEARDNPAAGRLGFRGVWNIANDKTPRDKDTARFLAELQRGFYEDQVKFLRDTGFKGLITCSNWTTADPKVLGPIEKWTYTAGDFIDRHGYFSGQHKGEHAEWSIRDGHTYSDRSALRFDGDEPGKPKAFVHPAMDPSYNNMPSMISETTFTRPNRYRTEAPLFYAAYGALQDSDSLVHFALDGINWSVKPSYFMQPWTLTSPTMMGQFPAAALIYRKGLVEPGEVLVDLNLRVDDVLDLEGTPMPQDAAFDELRLKDVPKGMEIKPGNVIDPLVHFAGRTNVNFTDERKPHKLVDLDKYINRKEQTVTSSHGQLKLDFGKGVLRIDAPGAQGAVGNLKDAGQVDLKDVQIASDMELVSVVAVSQDDQPLATSGRILLQVMSEEKASNFKTSGNGKTHTIDSIGVDPWLAREISGSVKFTRTDASSLKVSALDHNGYPVKELGGASEIKLEPTTAYYLISK